MKKWLTLMMVIALAVGCLACAHAESDVQIFTPTLTKAVTNTADEWFATSSSRALLTSLLSLDVVLEVGSDSSLSPDLVQSSYVGKNGQDLIVAMYTEGGQVMIVIYRPSSQEAGYSTLTSSASSDAILEMSLKPTCPDGVYKNSLTDIYTVMQQLQEIISNL